MAEAKKKSTKPVSDVAKPGESPAPATTKPVLVTNRPIMKDPMVVEKSGEALESAGSVIKRSGSVTVQPPSAPTLPDAKDEKVGAEPASTAEDVSVPAAEPPANPAQATTVESKSEVTKDEAAPKETGAKDTNEPSETPDATTKALEAEAAATAEADAKVQKLIDDKTYYLPIETVEKRRTKRVVILGVLVSVLLIAAWVDIALDAHLITIPGVKPVTHFFST